MNPRHPLASLLTPDIAKTALKNTTSPINEELHNLLEDYVKKPDNEDLIKYILTDDNNVKALEQIIHDELVIIQKELKQLNNRFTQKLKDKNNTTYGYPVGSIAIGSMNYEQNTIKLIQFLQNLDGIKVTTKSLSQLFGVINDSEDSESITCIIGLTTKRNLFIRVQQGQTRLQDIERIITDEKILKVLKSLPNNIYQNRQDSQDDI